MIEDLFDVQFTPIASKDLKKFRQWKVQVDNALHSLAIAPFSGSRLLGPLEGVRSLHLRLRGSGEARIAYVVYDDLRICLVIAVGMRENFYDIVERRFESLDD